MSSCFETVASLVKAEKPLPEILRNADKYLAHIHPVHKPELYEEHYDRVNNYFIQICEKNKLDPVINNLITAYTKAFFPESDFDQIAPYIKKLFIRTVIFHDFGKVNENFQADPRKMNNRLFKMTKGSPIEGNHSKLGAYIYIIKHFDECRTLKGLAKSEQLPLLNTVLLFSYSIIKHHASGLIRPDNQGINFTEEELQFMQKYLEEYGISVPDTLSKEKLKPEHLKQLWNRLTEDSCKSGFSLFALLRLNFSLLTAADYLATGQYSYQLELSDLSDWGILSDNQRDKIINAARNNPEKAYNTKAYELADEFQRGTFQLTHPTLANRANLNLLRTEMAVEVLSQLNQHTDKRLFYLEAPTGGGKTNLSMLAVAELLKQNPELNKVFYVFPFTTLITQTHKAIKDTLLLTDEEIALLHGRAGFQTRAQNNPEEEEKEDGLYGNQRKDFLQNLFALYPVAMVTHVRFFDILKSARKDDIYLMHRLSNSIVVLDELQSYPPKQWDKMLFLLDQYGRFFNIRFILMSATLPRLDRIEAVRRASQQLPDFIDLLPDATRYFQNDNFKGRVCFNFDLLEQGEMTAEVLAPFVLEKSRERAESKGGRIFTIIEFIYKKSATEFKTVIEQETPFFDKIFVLSGTILESRRREIINQLKRWQRDAHLKILLITTQVVEAGVDIDMDLGFKNISLIDSDEQLAGRVNRNVDKQDCVVYLFDKDDASVLYKSDLRFKITRELDADFHKQVLESKNFGLLYEKVFDEIEKKNKSVVVENFSDDYLEFLGTVNFSKVSEKFKLIDQQTLSVFVPLELPLTITGENGNNEPFFNTFELAFLKKTGVLLESDQGVDGEKVWTLYRRILSHPNEDFIAKKIEQKVLQGILAKFTFSLFSSDKNRTRLLTNSNPEKNLEDYFYLERWRTDAIYDITSGLDEDKMDDPII